MSNIRIIQTLLRNRRSLLSFAPAFWSPKRKGISLIAPSQFPSFQNTRLIPHVSFSCTTLRFVNTAASSEDDDDDDDSSDEGDRLQRETSQEVEMSDGWEEEDEAEPRVGDGGDGGGVDLQGVPWGQRALSIAQEVLMKFSDDIELFSFKTTPRGYVFVRLDKLTHKYGCPSMEELESYSQEYKKRLEEAGTLGEIPDNLALEVSSPGAERILKVPEDLNRFKDMPMRVCYAEDATNCVEKEGVFLLVSAEKEYENCVWKLADVKDNRGPSSKGRPLSRKRKNWRLNLPFNMHRRDLLLGMTIGTAKAYEGLYYLDISNCRERAKDWRELCSSERGM